MLKTKSSKMESGNEPEWLSEKRSEAFDYFKKEQMPLFTYGLNINLSIDLNLDNVDTNYLEKSNLEIKNNDKNVIVEDFSEALKNNGDFLKEKLFSTLNLDKFTSFHIALLNNLTLVKIPKNTEVKEPIVITSNMDSKALFDHLVIVAEENTKFTLIENSSSGKEDAYRSKVVEIFLADNVQANYGNVQLLNQETTNFTVKKAVIGKNSNINWMDCCFGSKATMSEVTTILQGEGSSTKNHGIFFGNKTQQFDLVANSIHKAPNTISDIYTKGALTDTSKCIYRGLVKIHDNAPGSNGYQKEDTLLLSKEAVADSIPNLEIDNNEVRCTHGATIGRIDREKMFYLQSRGLSEKEATQEYIKGFFESLIQKIQIKNLRDNMHKMVEERMG